MALLITYRNSDTITNWRIGEPISPNIKIFSVESIEAEGAELAHILDSFHNLPHHRNKKIQYWTGPLAQFIADNL